MSIIHKRALMRNYGWHRGKIDTWKATIHMRTIRRRRNARPGWRPTLGNSRVPADLIAECLDEGESPEEIAFNYRVPLEEVLNFKMSPKELHRGLGLLPCGTPPTGPRSSHALSRQSRP
jgi:uncharacterized protein (DUF433 family)